MTKVNETVICYAKRTPIGKIMGGLSSVPAPRLSAALIRDAVSSLLLKDSDVDEIILGNVLTAGIGQAPARQAAIYAGLSKHVQALTVGRVCGSGLKAVMLADQAIRLGDATTVFAGGQENMSLSPHLLPQSRTGVKFGGMSMLDSMQHDGLWDPYDNVAMGDCGEKCAKEYKFSREEQDQFAVRSYNRARTAWQDGSFAKEVYTIEIPGKKDSIKISQDEEPFAADLAKMSSLRPAFAKDGTITAANASSINDGAAVLLLTTRENANKKGWPVRARILSQASFAHEPSWFTTAPVNCIKKTLEKAKLQTKDIDLWEINEAFSVVPMAAIRDLGLDDSKVNIWGGAVSLGHPIGCSGARILVTLLHALEAKQKRLGLATLCIGGGEASAVIIERDNT